MELIKAIYSDLKTIFRWFVNLSPNVKEQKYWMYGFIGLVLLVLFLISHSHKENGMTDWISALANVVMAGAAIVGVFFAKGWMQQELAKEGIIISKGILRKLRSLNDDLESSLIIRTYTSLIVDNYIANNDESNLEGLNWLINVIDERVICLEQKLNEIKNSMDELKLNGWYFKTNSLLDEYRCLINSILKIKNCYIELKSYANLIVFQVDRRISRVDFFNASYVDRFDVEEIKVNLKFISDGYTDHRREFINSYCAFFSQGHFVAGYFDRSK